MSHNLSCLARVILLFHFRFYRKRGVIFSKRRPYRLYPYRTQLLFKGKWRPIRFSRRGLSLTFRRQRFPVRIFPSGAVSLRVRRTWMRFRRRRIPRRKRRRSRRRRRLRRRRRRRRRRRTRRRQKRRRARRRKRRRIRRRKRRRRRRRKRRRRRIFGLTRRARRWGRRGRPRYVMKIRYGRAGWKGVYYRRRSLRFNTRRGTFRIRCGDYFN